MSDRKTKRFSGAQYKKDGLKNKKQVRNLKDLLVNFYVMLTIKTQPSTQNND